MDSWQQNFVFSIKINWTIFAIAILVSIVVAWLAVGYKSIKAAIANPVKSIRMEYEIRVTSQKRKATVVINYYYQLLLSIRKHAAVKKDLQMGEYR